MNKIQWIGYWVLPKPKKPKNKEKIEEKILKRFNMLVKKDIYEWWTKIDLEWVKKFEVYLNKLNYSK